MGKLERVELSAGPVDYQDTGGDGPVLVFTHGFPMNELQWRKVVPLLDGHRCVLPTLPLGGHRTAMRPDADLSQRGIARLLGEFLDRLDLTDVTLVVNDWGGPQFLISEGGTDRVSRLVLVACEAFDNFPPAPIRPLARLCTVPGGPWLITRIMDTPFFRHSKRAFGGLVTGRIPDDVLDTWFTPAKRDAGIRRDLAKFGGSAPGAATLLEWSAGLREFTGPVLVVWAEDDRMMPAEHGPRLAEVFADARLARVAGSGTLVPEDQPEELARLLREFLAETG